MLVSDTSKQDATCLRMNWDTWGSEQLLNGTRPGGLDASPGSGKGGRGEKDFTGGLGKRSPRWELNQVKTGA